MQKGAAAEAILVGGSQIAMYSCLIIINFQPLIKMDFRLQISSRRLDIFWWPEDHGSCYFLQNLGEVGHYACVLLAEIREARRSWRTGFGSSTEQKTRPLACVRRRFAPAASHRNTPVGFHLPLPRGTTLISRRSRAALLPSPFAASLLHQRGLRVFPPRSQLGKQYCRICHRPFHGAFLLRCGSRDDSAPNR